MKRIVLLIGLSLFLASSGFAQGNQGSCFSLGPQLGYIDMAEEGWDSAVVLGVAGAMHSPERNFALWVELVSVEWELGDYSETSDGVLFEGKAKGGTRITPLTLTARYFLPPVNEPLRFYLGGGIGYYFNSSDAKATFTGAGRSGDYSEDIDNTVGFHVVGGLEWAFADNFLFDLGLKYAWAKADGEVAMSGPIFRNDIAESVEYDLNAFTVELGARYLFW